MVCHLCSIPRSIRTQKILEEKSSTFSAIRTFFRLNFSPSSIALWRNQVLPEHSENQCVQVWHHFQVLRCLDFQYFPYNKITDISLPSQCLVELIWNQNGQIGNFLCHWFNFMQKLNWAYMSLCSLCINLHFHFVKLSPSLN